MKVFGRLALASSISLALTVPAMAGVTINSPANDATVSSPFTLSATSATCGGKSVTTMGYSFDSSADTQVFSGQSMDGPVSVAAGTHTLHVKSWGSGTACVEDVVIDVGSSAAANSALVPSSADSVSNIQALGGWAATHDTGGPGASSGASAIVSTPSLYGGTREFLTEFSGSGDERYSVSFSDNTSAQNFFYDGWVYLTTSSSELANLEFDVNQTMSNGQTMLAGLQCDGYSGTWTYTDNEGSASNPKPAWVSKSGTSCNPRSWKQNAWHHIQFDLSRSSSGVITYKSVWVDGAQQNLNATANGAADLGWGPVVNTQFQTDGLGSSGHVTAYLDDLTVSMW